MNHIKQRQSNKRVVFLLNETTPRKTLSSLASGSLNASYSPNSPARRSPALQLAIAGGQPCFAAADNAPSGHCLCPPDPLDADGEAGLPAWLLPCVRRARHAPLFFRKKVGLSSVWGQSMTQRRPCGGRRWMIGLDDRTFGRLKKPSFDSGGFLSCRFFYTRK